MATASECQREQRQRKNYRRRTNGTGGFGQQGGGHHGDKTRSYGQCFRWQPQKTSPAPTRKCAPSTARHAAGGENHQPLSIITTASQRRGLSVSPIAFR